GQTQGHDGQSSAGRPVGERVALKTELLVELDGLPADTPDIAEARVVLSTYLAVALIDSRRLPEARELLASARSLGNEIGDPTAALIAEWWTAMADFAAGDIEGAIGRVADVALEAERAGHGSIGVSAFRDAGSLAVAGLRYDAASRWIGEGLRYADSIEQSHCAHVMSATSALVAWAAADWDVAAARAEQAVADKGCQRAAAMARWALGYVLLGRGDLDGATAVLADAFAFGERSEEIGLILPPLWGLAEVAWLDGDPERAFALCEDARVRATSGGERALLTPFVVTGVRAAQGAGRPADGATWLAACAELLGSIPAVAGAALEHGRGLVALADGATGIARIALAAAVVGWDEHGRAWESTWARLDLAHCCIRSTRFAEAVGHATDARTTALRLDARRLVHRAEELQRMARGHAPDDEPWRPLTAREFEVARLVSEGRTNAEIAASLGIAPKTASSHVEHILAKLGASRRTEIATWASHVPGVGAPT
ncbi:MAG: LuxR C-terminal-related transcriptional regulator, partial [Candidatus Limnocylindrales bacterium]